MTADTRGRSGAKSPSGARPSRGVLLLVVAAVAVVAIMLVGVRLATQILSPSGRAAAAAAALADPASPALAIGMPIRTSFGSLTATEVEVNKGVAVQDMGSMPMSNMPGMAMTGSSQVNAMVRLTNTGKHSIAVAPTQFRLLAGTNGAPAGKPIAATGTTLQAGPLLGHTAVDARLSFVAPADGSQLWLEYTDPAGGVTKVALAKTPVTPGGTTHSH